jgi:hypothetical protein
MNEFYFMLVMFGVWVGGAFLANVLGTQHAVVKRSYSYYDNKTTVEVVSWTESWDTFPLLVVPFAGLFAIPYLLYKGWVQDPTINKRLRKVARQERKKQRAQCVIDRKREKQKALEEKVKLTQSVL